MQVAGDNADSCWCRLQDTRDNADSCWCRLQDTRDNTDSCWCRLQEMLLTAVRRIGEYVKLLTWFEFHTPRTHADRQDLNNVIATVTELDRGMREVRQMMKMKEVWFCFHRKGGEGDEAYDEEEIRFLRAMRNVLGGVGIPGRGSSSSEQD